MQDSERFAANMMGMAEVLGADVSPLKMRIYEKALEAYTDEQIERAISTAIMSLKFFPKPVELIDLIEGNPDERAIEAWGLVLETIRHHGAYKSIQFEDPKISHCVEMMGGWIELCRMRVEETGMRSSQFIKMYRACPGTVPAKQLAGIEEMQRTLDGKKWPDRLEEMRPVLVGRNGNGTKQITEWESDVELEASQ